MKDILYYSIIYPIELLIEVIFSIIDRISSNPGIAIIGVSLTISVMLLPLYIRADAIQSEERRKQDQMRHWTDHIKKTFKGDERFMMLQMYYSEQDYHQLYSLRSSISLLLQIPFFIAAYHFLSHLELLNGVSFLGIPDLGKADGIIQIGSVSVNLLPVLMTVINCIASVIYTWKPGSVGLLRSIKDNAQLYILALVFLILLYPSPSGLVLYWTMNNVFSLGKNVVSRMRHPKVVISIICSVLGIILGFLVLIRFNSLGAKKGLFGLLAVLVLQIPTIITGIRRARTQRRDASGQNKSVNRQKDVVFFISCILLTVLTGVMIPSAIVNASPGEFVLLHSATTCAMWQ